MNDVLIKIFLFSLLAGTTGVQADKIYDVDIPIDTGSVNGVIETDDAFGALTVENIIGWDLQLFNGIDSFVINTANSVIDFSGPVDATATADGLYFNFSTDPANIAFTQSVQPRWHFGIHASNVHSATFAVGPPVSFVQSVETGVVQFATLRVIDTDGDGIPAEIDNCTLVSNFDQRDTNNDGFGNACDPDINNDGVVNYADVSMWVPFFNTDTTGDEDFNGDGSANFGDYFLFPNYFLQSPGPSGLVP